MRQPAGRGEKKRIKVDLEKLSQLLGVPVVGTAARSRKGLDKLLQTMSSAAGGDSPPFPVVTYSEKTEQALGRLTPLVNKICGDAVDPRWLSLKLLEREENLLVSIGKYLGFSPQENPRFQSSLSGVGGTGQSGLTPEELKDDLVSGVVQQAERLARAVVTVEHEGYNARDKRIDRILTSKLTGFPIMFLVLLVIFWLTITGANYPPSC